MAQHPKGGRRAVMVRMPPELHARILQACRDEGVYGASQYIGDVMAAHFGMDHLIYERGTPGTQTDLLTA